PEPEAAPAPSAPPSRSSLTRRLPVLVIAAAALIGLSLIGVSIWLAGAFALRREGPPRNVGGQQGPGSAASPGAPNAGTPGGVPSTGGPEAAWAFRIEGRILDGQGRPAPGVEVTAYRDLPREEARETFDRWSFVDFLKANSNGLRSLGSARSAENGQFS